VDSAAMKTEGSSRARDAAMVFDGRLIRPMVPVAETLILGS
jgi:hypothetical protein